MRGRRHDSCFARVWAEQWRWISAGPSRGPPLPRWRDTPATSGTQARSYAAALRPRRRPARHYMSRHAAGTEAPRRGLTLAAHGVAFSEARPGLGAAPISRAATSESRSAPSPLRTAPPAPRAAGRAPAACAAFRRQAAAGRPSMAPAGRWRRAARRGPGGARGGCGLPGGRGTAAAAP